jgi:predicted CopG family antitoxin
MDKYRRIPVTQDVYEELSLLKAKFRPRLSNTELIRMLIRTYYECSEVVADGGKQ